MSHIDVVARLAQSGEPPSPAARPMTPAVLIDTYCQPGMPSGFCASERRAHSGWHAGFVGWTGGPRGYDDGYSYMEALIGAGWLPRPEIGDWPYVIYLVWPARASDPRYAIAHYCEGDFGVEIFDDRQGAQVALRALREPSEEASDE